MDSSNESDSGKDEEVLRKKIKLEKEDDQSLSSEGEKSSEEEKAVDPVEDENGIYLPVEIMEKIFEYVDGKTLATVRLVCSLWKAIADRMYSMQINVWMDFCISEIPKEQIHDYLSRSDSKYFLRAIPIPEIAKVYKRWKLWKKFLSFSKSINHTIIAQERIYDIKCSGNCLLIGTSNSLYAYNCDSDDVKRLVHYGVQNYVMVKWLNLRSTVVEPIVGDGAFHGMGHDSVTFELATQVCEFNFSPIPQLRILHQKPIANLKRNYLTYKDIQVFLESTEHNCTINVQMSSGRKSKLYDNNFELLTLYNGCIMLYDNSSQTIKIIDLNFNELTTYPLYGAYLRDNSHVEHYVIGVDAIITYTARGNPLPLLIKVGRCTIEMPSLHKVSCVLFYGSHLFLGTRNGELIVFLIKTLEDLLLLEEPIMQQSDRKQILQIGDKHLISMDVREGCPVNSIFVASMMNIYEIRFSLLEHLSDVCKQQFLQ